MDEFLSVSEKDKQRLEGVKELALELMGYYDRMSDSSSDKGKGKAIEVSLSESESNTSENNSIHINRQAQINSDRLLAERLQEWDISYESHLNQNIAGPSTVSVNPKKDI